MTGERRAWVCERCAKEGLPHRHFQRPGEPEPRCPHHGKMSRQANAPYNARGGKGRGESA